MGWTDVFKLSREVQQIEDAAPTFAVDAEAVPPQVFGLAAYEQNLTRAARIDRRTAIQVPAVKRSRDLIAGPLGTLPLHLVGPDHRRSTNALFEQPEKDVPRSVTMTRTAEDLLFEGVAWWLVVGFDSRLYPVEVVRLDPRSVDVLADGRVHVTGDGHRGTSTRYPQDSELIRFDSPNDPLLVAGARAIRTALLLDKAAANHADGAPPLDFFTPADGVDPGDDDVIQDMLDGWQTARRTRSTGYVPAALKYNVGGFNPKDLQLAEARQHAVIEIARAAGVDAEELSVSTTSRTYMNSFDRRKNFLDFTLGGYRTAIEDRLSMHDVTPRGYRARFDLDDFLRSDPKTRFETYQTAIAVGAMTQPEVREAEDRPALAATDEETPVTATTEPAKTFDTEPAIKLDAPGAVAFEVDAEKRTIKGLLVPYGVPARSNGSLWQFSKGTLQYAAVSRVKLWVQHDANRAVGVATELDDREDGLYGSFKVARGAAGDEALSYAEDGVLDGFSIGLGQGGKFTRRDDINHAVSAPLMETSLTPAPSFDDARVHAVAASAAHIEGDKMPDEKTAEAPDFSAIGNAIKDGLAAGFAAEAERHSKDGGREVVSAGRPTQITEEPCYRFDGAPGKFGFVEDMRSASSGDSEAKQRLAEFTSEAFAVTTGNASTLNPTKNRPELYVPNLQYTRPLWDSVSTGVIADKTPFTIPKFGSASGLVGTHVEGVEPTPGSFTATNQTVIPSGVSGKIEINTEVLDQGGSPQADSIIWGEMLNAWYEGLEARLATAFAAVTTTEVNLASAVNAALVTSIENQFLNLQFARGGHRYSGFVADGMLFRALAGAADTTGRPLLPITGATNADGSLSGGFDRINLGNQTVRAAWALGSSNASRSYIFVPSSVWAWASAPEKFEFRYQMKSIDLGIWGYAATAVLRESDVIPVDYTTADA